MGYLDWATQPNPFRRYEGACPIELPRTAFTGPAAQAPLSIDTLGEFLRCSMGLSAWKQFGASRWALRVNPSSGNLHPTEAWVVWDNRVCHYAPADHVLEQRCELGPPLPCNLSPDTFLVALTSIHWREAWKYGERAFRYCQHDVGHAIGALRIAAARLGWGLTLLPRWSDDDVSVLLGLDRDADYAGAEREHPDCIAVVTAGSALLSDVDPRPFLDAARAGVWSGIANRLSPDHVEWPIIEEVAAATRQQGAGGPGPGNPGLRIAAGPAAYSRALILQRRSATAFDGRYALRRDVFLSMLARLDAQAPPCDAIGWPPQVHLAMFVHRIEGLTPGVYAWLRDPAAVDAWRSAMRPEFLWEQPEPGIPLYLLLPIDCRQSANRLSCNQDIAADGFFSLAMIARFEPALREFGASFYKRLFWETGLLGQIFYLEAEAAGARATGIGCFFDDAVHETLGLRGHEWQSLYHFSMGMPIDDARLTTEPGYEWEKVSGLQTTVSGRDRSPETED